MLEVNKDYTSTSPEVHFDGSTTGSPAELVSAAMGILRRQWRVLATFFVLTLAAAFTYYARSTPTYKSTATVAIDTRKFQLFQQPAQLGEVSIDSSSAVESQLEILKSEKIALKVINDLHLADGIPQGAPPAWWEKLLGARPPMSDFERARAALAVFQSRLTVTRLGIAWVIEISYESPNAERAALIANTTADTYVTDQLEAKYEATRLGSAWLEGRITDLRAQAMAAQRAVVEFKVQNNIVDAGSGRLMTDQQLTDLNTQLATARAQTSEAKARFERITAIVRAASDETTVNASLTGILTNDTLTKLRAQYAELSSRETDFEQKYGRNHLSVINIRSQMTQVRAAMLDEARRLAESFKSDYDLAASREKNLEADFAKAVSQSESINRALVRLRELESAAQTATGLYENFQKRYMESLEQQSFPVTEARVITRAVPALTREHKKLVKMLAAIFGGGASLGVGLALFRELSDRVYRTVPQVEQRLQMNCITLVPHVKTEVDSRPARPLLRKKDGKDALELRTIEDTRGPIWYVVNSPLSAYAEAMRSLKLAIDLNAMTKTTKVIGLTSSLPREGKSTIAASLALTIAQAGARVILLDCDLRNPTLTRALAAGATQGLLEVLSGRMPLKDALWTDRRKLVPFLPAAVNSRFVQSNEIMGSRAAKQFFEGLRNEYDYVVADLPPLAPVVDTRATTHLVDSYIFVIEWGRTKIDVVEHALSRAPGVSENVLGVVLNNVDMSRLKNYDEKNASYYKNKHYSQYGYVD